MTTWSIESKTTASTKIYSQRERQGRKPVKSLSTESFETFKPSAVIHILPRKRDSTILFEDSTRNEVHRRTASQGSMPSNIINDVQKFNTKKPRWVILKASASSSDHNNEISTEFSDRIVRINADYWLDDAQRERVDDRDLNGDAMPKANNITRKC